MPYVVGQKFRVKNDFPNPDYRGRVFIATNICKYRTDYGYDIVCSIATNICKYRTDYGYDIVCSVDYDGREVAFRSNALEHIEVPGRCHMCDAITPGRTICCECKDK